MIAERTRHGYLPAATPLPGERLAEYETRRDGTSDWHLSRRLAGEAIQRAIRTQGWHRALPRIRAIRDALAAPAPCSTTAHTPAEHGAGLFQDSQQ